MTSHIDHFSCCRHGPVALFEWEVAEGFPLARASESAAGILGYSVAELEGDGFFFSELVHEEDRKRLNHHFDDLANGGGGAETEIEVRVRTRDGGLRWLRGYVDGGGSDGRLGGYMVDVTGEKMVEANAKDGEHAAEILLEASADDILLLDTKGTILAASSKVCETVKVLEQLKEGRVKEALEFSEEIEGPVSPDWIEQARRKAAMLVGQKIWDLFPKSLARERKKKFRQVIKTKIPVRFEDDAHGQFFEHYLRPILDGAGKVIRVATYSRNVTAARRVEERLRNSEQVKEALQESQDLLQVTINRLLAGVVTIDETGTIESVNDACKEIFGYEKNEMLGQDVKLLIPQPYRSEHGSHLHRYRDTGNARIIGTGREVVGLRKDGTMFPMDLDVVEIFSHGQRKFTGVIRDITERKQAAQALQDARDNLEKRVRERTAELHQALKLAAIGEMLSGIAHEINQSLSTIMITSALALRAVSQPEPDRKEVAKRLGIIDQQTSHMAVIVNHMLLFTHRDEAEAVTFDPEETIARVLENLSVQLAPLPFELAASLNGGGHLTLGQPDELEQVILNLLTNARDAVMLKFEAAGGKGGYSPRIEVSVEARDVDRSIVIAVSDNGGGIPEEVLQNIFDPFFTTKSRGKGTGLGLSISLAIIHNMEGTLEAGNTDAGAAFRIVLPEAPEGQTGDGASVTGGEKSSATHYRTLIRGLGVLVVDDEETIAQGIADYLKDAGCRTALAYNGREALKLWDAGEL